MDIATANAMTYQEFMDTFGNVVEKCPLITAAVWSKRPFDNFLQLENSVFDFIDALPTSGKQGVLRCHPDLAGRELLSGTLTAESRREQHQAGLTSLKPEERQELSQLNSSYKDKFGFPFVICAKMSEKGKILQQISERVQNSPQQELCQGIEEVKKICHLRLQDIRSLATPTSSLATPTKL
ncbi:putative 2-oxo-4-hydroxy-4-carboxy-5-ureidoimidazoline decarboxylase [Ambystoma mexicanum]|uniref:putative 2-oxo-4-hydroxy-4-carboxy-5-ureidoimidazoline decarboxylase n=1 Tax=Ambystoma mexicanum TaxID=8296 RepID=UPI0037E99E0D